MTETALRTAKAVVVLWSPRSVVSRWVRAEATLADRNKTLVPCMIEACGRPIMFELTQTADLSRWQGEATDMAWLAFLADVRRIVLKHVSPTPGPVVTLPTAGDTRQARSGGVPSLAVLPFTNRSGLPEDDLFAYGMVEDVIDALSLSAGVRIIASSATARFRKGAIPDLAAMAEQLRVRYVLEGNIRRAGDAMRVTAQLVDAAHGAILWTQKFDRPLAELAALQEALVIEVAGHLGVQVRNIEIQRALRKPGDITAYEALMRAWAAYANYSADSLSLAAAESRKAVALAPDFALAHASLASALSNLFALGGYRDTTLRDEAVDHAERALTLGGHTAALLYSAAGVMGRTGRFEEALRYAERAVALNPNLSSAREILGSALAHFNRLDEALTAYEEEERLAPGAFTLFMNHARRSWVHYAAGRLSEAMDAVDMSQMLGQTPFALIGKVSFLEDLGRRAEAQDTIRLLRRLEPETSLDLHVARIEGSFLPPNVMSAFVASFRRVWNATPTEPGA